jgi:4-alpha-glucanotransferase
VYVSLIDLPELAGAGAKSAALKSAGLKAVAADIKKARPGLEDAPRVDFSRVRALKLEFLRRIYDEAYGAAPGAEAGGAQGKGKGKAGKKAAGDAPRPASTGAGGRANEALEAWIKKNPWVKEYALFCVLKARSGEASWTQWKVLKKFSPEALDAAWKDPGEKKELLFHAWVQMRLEEQFRAAAEKLDKLGILLKGDLPIMMSEDSADVWAHPELFSLSLRAGAPPDMFSPTGQNWGFPIYEWKNHKKSSYAWWRERLLRAELFYHAYRIDHVLGFFRIWAVPSRETDGVLGFFKPSRFITRTGLEAAGFDASRVRWLSQPHVPGEGVRRIFDSGPEDDASKVFERLGNEDLYLFKKTVSESFIHALKLEGEKTRLLLDFYRDRALVEVKEGEFAPAWYRDNSRAMKSLGDSERKAFAGLIAAYFDESEKSWAQDGETLLGVLKETSSMLPCAEDLGVVPDSVPGVLEKLGILGLRIPRWVRRYHETGEPFVRPEDYPPLTVCAASVHDTTTLREWWQTESGRGFWQSLGLAGDAPVDYTTDTAQKVLGGLLGAASVLVTFQLQDFFALEENLRAPSAADERVNVPGTVTDANWSYRLPFTLEELTASKSLSGRIKALVEVRRKRKFPKE